MDAQTRRALDVVRKHDRNAIIEEQRATIAKQARELAEQKRVIAAQASELFDVNVYWRSGLNYEFWTGVSNVPFLDNRER